MLILFKKENKFLSVLIIFKKKKISRVCTKITLNLILTPLCVTIGNCFVHLFSPILAICFFYKMFYLLNIFLSSSGCQKQENKAWKQPMILSITNWMQRLVNKTGDITGYVQRYDGRYHTQKILESSEIPPPPLIFPSIGKIEFFLPIDCPKITFFVLYDSNSVMKP